MSADWKRNATQLLIESYKKHPILYDMRHPRYYNKSVRAKALAEMVDAVRHERPETTMKDVVRKIQTLRTQFGQELTKTRRQSMKGSEYHPTVWWYQGLSFLQHHIKPRSAANCSLTLAQSDMDGWKPDPDDSSTYNVSIVRNGSSVSPSEQHTGDYEHSGEEMEYETEVHYEINSIDLKDMKTLEVKPILSGASAAVKRESRYLEREDRKVTRLSHTEEAAKEQTHKTRSPVPIEPANDPEPEPITATTLVELKPIKTLADGSPDERHKSLGHFVGTQMACIKDDFIYYETQMEILNLMNRGILRQLALDKKNSSKADNENGKDRDKKKSAD